MESYGEIVFEHCPDYELPPEFYGASCPLKYVTDFAVKEQQDKAQSGSKATDTQKNGVSPQRTNGTVTIRTVTPQKIVKQPAQRPSNGKPLPDTNRSVYGQD
ncbi:MAG: hypothetical protein UT34_C0001G0004 [candidate division WS6 bacterium GW2011_GWF2_39_15]|uniref:Uncharacterized protein n=1 Tax=candidate division WS6 bacterium GW2011_GWF2_39_15 TaxID=1619100 RepID=A0A0G0MPI3_9BACT|nr:MAG: hypothetical protein UT34_C0001G0004 [candidate division WS6 bacterium GW2011_GWF2_39_15]